MKVIVINGSPRKTWNTMQLVNKFIEGMKTQKELDVKYINVYDYNFTGCKSCFACKLKRFEDQPLECRIKDDIHDLLVETRNADAIVLGTPIYFMDMSAQVKAFLERLMYPGKSSKVLPATFIYTMNAPQEVFDKYIKSSVGIIENFYQNNFGYAPKTICAYDTYQRDHEELYKKSSHDMAGKKIRRETQFPIDLENAYQAGISFAQELGK